MPLTWGRQVREARLARGLSQYALWLRIVAVFGEHAICLQTVKNAELDRNTAEARTRSQITRVLPETK